jgi:hypothetical protein
MSTRRRAWKVAALVAMAASLAMTGTAAAAAESTTNAAVGRCRGGVFLDGIRALELTGDAGGGRDEVQLEMLNNGGEFVPIWPRTEPHVSMGLGQRVEVDQCRAAHRVLRLIEIDDLSGDDIIGTVTLQGEVTRNYIFSRPGHSGRYRLGVLR